MLTQGFYYFLIIGQLAMLGLIIAGIYMKVKRIISMSAERTDDQNSEHYVSEFDQLAEARGDSYVDRTIGWRSHSGEIKSGQTPSPLNS